MSTAAARRRRNSTSADAERQRRCRARRQQGQALFTLALDEHAVAEALILSGRLTEAEALHRQMVERELRKVVLEWAERWLSHVT